MARDRFSYNGSVMFSYVAGSGGKVKIPKLVNPYKELGAAVTVTNEEIKEEFKQRANRPQR